jgi:hypothetical protein
MIKYLVSFACLFAASAQGQDLLNRSNVTGNMETNLQYLNSDTLIGAAAPEQKAVMNTYMNVNYSLGKFRTGVRFESYLPAIAGYPAFYEGTGIGYRYAQYAGDRLSVTAGNFYEQFGNGLIFRSYEERALGLDNVMDGANIKFLPRKGIQLKGVFGKQRYSFFDGKVNLSNGVVRGVDGEINLNDLIPKFTESKFKVTIGASFVSKYQSANNDTIILPKNVGSYGARLSLKYGKVYFNAEYTKKENDPSAQNNYIYNNGHAALITMGYSTKGFGLLLSARSIDNMSFRSDRTVIGNQLFINYLPALSKQHTYNLAGTLYPYAAVPNGEVAYQLEMLYKIPKNSKLGGHYGTDIQLNSAIALHPMRHTSNMEFDKNRVLYKGNLFDSSDSLYFYDFNFHIYRKLTKKFKASVHYFHFVFNNDVNTVTKLADGYIHSDIGVLEMQYTAKKHSVRMEVQGLWTKQDKGNWGTVLLEYTFSPHWFVAVMDQYNYGHPDEHYRLHYLLGSFGYSFDNTRFMLSYGKQRAGIVCIGGVCRPVPATNGLTFSFTTSF